MHFKTFNITIVFLLGLLKQKWPTDIVNLLALTTQHFKTYEKQLLNFDVSLTEKNKRNV